MATQEDGVQRDLIPVEQYRSKDACADALRTGALTLVDTGVVPALMTAQQELLDNKRGVRTKLVASGPDTNAVEEVLAEHRTLLGDIPLTTVVPDIEKPIPTPRIGIVLEVSEGPVLPGNGGIEPAYRQLVSVVATPVTVEFTFGTPQADLMYRDFYHEDRLNGAAGMFGETLGMIRELPATLR